MSSIRGNAAVSARGSLAPTQVTRAKPHFRAPPVLSEPVSPLARDQCGFSKRTYIYREHQQTDDRGIAHMEDILLETLKREPLALALAAIALCVTVFRLVNERKGERHHAFFYLHEHLAKSEFSVARRRVRTALWRKEYSEWDDEDREMANRVCASYDQAGILILDKAIDAKSAERFLRTSWGESICDQYEALQDFLNDWQTPWKRGKDFFVHFGRLYKMARRYHRKRIGIVSGGQSGADRAALDVAIDLGLPYGGWVPKGGWAEDHPTAPGLLTRFPNMREAESPEPAQRTRLNVRDSTATVILIAGASTSPGTDLTRDEATKRRRPHKIVDVDDPNAAELIKNWLRQIDYLHVLNVAGPRESEAPGLYDKARRVLREVLVDYSAD